MEDQDFLNGRLHNSFFEDNLEDTSFEVGDDLITKYGKKINVYKFKKVSGAIRLTNEGERGLNYSNDSFRQTTNIYTGRNPITVVWEGSTKLIVKENNKIIKETKIGTYYELYFNSPNNTQLVVDNVNILNKDYVNSYINRDITLYSYDWNPSDNDILDYVYLIFDKRNQSLQWLEISSIEPYYHENTKKHIYTTINFENVNLKYSRTGKTLIDFIQLGAIGEGYCFPKEDEEGNVSLDQDKLLRTNQGVNQIQFDFNGGTGNSSFLFWGRRKEKLVNGEIELDIPHMIFPYQINFPKSGEFFYKQPNSNSYAIINALPTKNEIWASYKESYKGNDRIGEYNVDKQKEVLTGFQVDLFKVRETNPNLSTYINWDNTNNITINIDVDLKGIPYLDTTITKIDRQVDYATFLIINSFFNWTSDVFNFDYRETTKYKLTDTLGLLGSIVNTLVGGLDIGWTSTNSLGPKQPINFLCPCISFEDGKAALSDRAPLPTDIFIDNNEKKILPTATNILTSWNMSLTDAFIDQNKVVENAPIGKGGNGIWLTKYLGQKVDEQGNNLLPNGEALLLNLNTFRPIRIADEVPNFIIDYVDFKAIGQSDFRISSYNKNGENVYSSYQETFSKARDEITLWGNQVKFNYYNKENTQGELTWPESVLPPKPQENVFSFTMKDSVDKTLFVDCEILFDYFDENNRYRKYDFNLYNEELLKEFNGTLTTNIDKIQTGYVVPQTTSRVIRTFNPTTGNDSIFYQPQNNETIVIKPKKSTYINFDDEIVDINNFEKMIIEFNSDNKIEVSIDSITQPGGYKAFFRVKETVDFIENNVGYVFTKSGESFNLESTYQPRNKVLKLSFEEGLLSKSFYFQINIEGRKIQIYPTFDITKKISLTQIDKVGKNEIQMNSYFLKDTVLGDFRNPLKDFKINKITLIPKIKNKI